jgi:L-aspartate oxidase
VVTKKQADEANTNYAQGGIAAVFDAQDSFRDHERDTQCTGAGLCDPAVVRTVVEEAPERVRELAALGVRFNRTARGFALGREGGHSRRRIVHASDFTGREIERALLEQVRSHPRVRVLENHLAVDLLLDSRLRKRARSGKPDRCWGAYVLDRASGRIRPITARATVLATGDAARSTPRRIRTWRPATAARWHGARGPRSRISSSYSSIRRACITRARSPSC